METLSAREAVATGGWTRHYTDISTMIEVKSNALLGMNDDGCTLKELLVERRCRLLMKTKEGGSVENFGLHEMDSELCDASHNSESQFE